MKRTALDGDVGRIDATSACSGELSSFKFALSKLVVASEVAAIVKVDIGIPACPIYSVVTFFSCEFNGAGLHKLI